jgi:intein/homing endonuclease
MVWTRKGLRKVLNVWENGIRDVRKYELDGRKLECTDDHHIFTKNRGFVKASELMQSDIFHSFEENKILCQNLQQKKMSFKLSTGSILDYIQPKYILKAGVLSMESKLKHQRIVTFGKRITEKSQKAIRFITKTKISQTIQSKILKCLHRNNIQKSIIQKSEGSKIEKYLTKEQNQKRLNGTSQKMGENGIQNTQRKVCFPTKIDVWNAQNVKNNSKQNSKFKNIAVENVKKDSTTTKRKVYDLEVEGEHEYFANNILVHNCSDALEYFICELCREWLKD